VSIGVGRHSSTYNKCVTLWRVMLFRWSSKLNLGTETTDACNVGELVKSRRGLADSSHVHRRKV
jgi:hypothetical protein